MVPVNIPFPPILLEPRFYPVTVSAPTNSTAPPPPPPDLESPPLIVPRRSCTNKKMQPKTQTWFVRWTLTPTPPPLFCSLPLLSLLFLQPRVTCKGLAVLWECVFRWFGFVYLRSKNLHSVNGFVWIAISFFIYQNSMIWDHVFAHLCSKFKNMLCTNRNWRQIIARN